MATLTVQIDKEKDLPVLQAILQKLGLEYEVEEDEDWGDLSAAEIKGIKAGIEDFKAGRILTGEEADARIAAKLKQLGID